MTAQGTEKHDDEQSPEDSGRADLYRLLGNLLAAPPQQATLDVVQQLSVPVCGEASAGLEQALRSLRDAAGAATPGKLEEEYFALFIGLGRGELCPYASWYRTGYLMEQPLAMLRSDLKRLGFVRREGVGEPEDHAAALCEVMAMIISETVLSCGDQQEFFERHLRPWLPQFFADLGQAEHADFYRSVGSAGQAFMNIEQQYFSMLV
ncbi:MAG TPA: molecular chaperone TorD [Gammaproteobacteria bacterium]|nr:molecular chaperone TorD [Gammaproteobacteria bacterium]